MFRKLFPVFIMLVVLSMLLVACGGGAETAPAEPATEEPAAEEPVAEEPATEEPAVEEPVAEEPTAEEPTEEPVVEEPGETEGPAPAQGERGEILNRVLERGRLIYPRANFI